MDLNLIAVSDVHADEQAAERILERLKSGTFSGLVIAGDTTDFGPLSFAEDLVTSAQSLGVRVFAVPGNADPPEIIGLFEKNGASVHNRKLPLGNGWSIAGFGGVSDAGRGLTLFPEEEIYSSLAALKPDNKTILVTHAPPFSVAGFDRVPSGASVGSPAIRRIVEEFRPAALICGHIHENEGAERFGGTLIVKVGPANRLRAAEMRLGREIHATSAGI